MVELRGVSQRAGSTLILDDLELSFRAGRFNVIVGPNGAGKSTALRVASGLLRPSSGQVLYDGRPLTSFGAIELARRRAVLSQHVELAFPLPAEDVVLMGRYPHYARAPSGRDFEIVSRALDLVGLSGKRTQPYPTLSGGEQQKVQLARVLAQIWNEDEPRSPRTLFLDEPTTSLDVHYTLHLLDVARGLLSHDCTVVAVLHDLNVAFEYADAAFVLERGRLAAESDDPGALPAELLERVFAVRARRVLDAEQRRGLWQFSL
jgi:heme transport system ATP-binding protein